MKQTPETIVLLNFVCEDIQKAARLVRDSGIYTMVMPYTTPVDRVMQEKPVGLIVCADQGVPAREADLNRFKAMGLPLLELTITKDNLAAQAEKAIAFCKENAAATASGNSKTSSTKRWRTSALRSGIRKSCWVFPAAWIPRSWPP